MSNSKNSSEVRYFPKSTVSTSKMSHSNSQRGGGKENWRQSEGGKHHLSTGKQKQQSLKMKHAEMSMVAQNLVVGSETYIDEEELKHLQAQFEQFDSDDSGRIETREFVEICLKVGIPRSESLQMVKEIDDNDDGFITFSEFTNHDVIHLLTEALRKQRNEENKTLEKKEARTHVNVEQITRIVKSKMMRSKMAYSFIRYFIFLIVYVYVVIEQRSPKSALDMRAALKNYFVGSAYRTPNGQELKTWLDIRSPEDFWDWTQIHFASLYHLETYYNRDTFSRADRGTILQHFRMTSGFRMVQRRGKNGTCSNYPKYSNFADDCYADTYVEGQYGPAYDTSSFKGVSTGTSYKHEEKSWYDFGFFETFDQNRTATDLHLQRLREDLWINKGTRFVKIDFVAYCRNTGQFALVEFKVDMRVSGALVPTVEVVCRRYGFYQTRDDWLRLTLEIVVTCSTVAYTYFLVLKIINDAKEEGRYFAFFDSDWNCVDFLHCLFLLLVIALWLYIVNDPSIRSLEITENSIRMGGKVVSFAQSATAFETYFTLNGINMLLGLCRCMKFLRMNGHLGQLTDTLALMKEGIVQFMFIFLLSVVTFMCVGQMLFGHQVLMFSDPLFALDSVLGFVVGTSDTGSLYETSTVSAVIFEGPFVLTMIFFILPLTIAIIMDGYSEMQASQEHDPHSRLHELVNIGVFEQAYRGVTRSMQYFVKDKPNHPQLRFPDLPTLLQLMSEFDDTPVISYSDFRKRLKHRNIPEGLLIDILEKYDAFQHDPQWQYLEMENQEEIDAANEANAGTAPVQLAELLDDMEDRVERVLTDLTYANGKLDLLINMFTT